MFRSEYKHHWPLSQVKFTNMKYVKYNWNLQTFKNPPQIFRLSIKKIVKKLSFDMCFHRLERGPEHRLKLKDLWKKFLYWKTLISLLIILKCIISLHFLNKNIKSINFLFICHFIILSNVLIHIWYQWKLYPYSIAQQYDTKFNYFYNNSK